MTCRTCKFLDVPLDKAGRRRPYKNLAYPCTYEIPYPVLPDAVTRHFGFHWPPARTYMSPRYGANCPCYEEFVSPGKVDVD